MLRDEKRSHWDAGSGGAGGLRDSRCFSLRWDGSWPALKLHSWFQGALHVREREKTIKGDSKKPLSNVDAILLNEVWTGVSCAGQCYSDTNIPWRQKDPLAADTGLIVRLLRLVKMCCEHQPQTRSWQQNTNTRTVGCESFGCLFAFSLLL